MGEVQELNATFQVRGAMQRLVVHEEWKDHREILLDGPVGTAKTMGVGWLIHTTCIEYPGTRWLVFRKTRVSLNNSFIKSYRDVLTDPRIHLLTEFGEDPPEWAQDAVREHLMKLNGYLFEGRLDATRDEFVYKRPPGYKGPPSKIILAGMDNPTRMRSSEYDAAFCNEVTELTLEDYESIRRSLRNRVLPAHPFISDCNPGPPNHFLMRRVADGRTERFQCFYDDNPWITDTSAGQQYKTDVFGSYTGHRLRRMAYGEWCGAEGMIWPEFQLSKHVIRGYLDKRDGGWWLVITKGKNATEVDPDDEFTGPEEIRIRRFFAAQDWGFVNPGVQQVWGMDDAGNLYMVREHYMTGKLIDWWAEVAVQNYKEFECHPIICDPSKPDAIEVFNDRLGVPKDRPLARIAAAAENAVVAGLDHVRDRMDGEPTIFFLDNALAHEPDVQLTGVGDGSSASSRKPYQTIDEIPAYVYKDVDDGKEDKEQPKKVDDHGCDATRYAVFWAWRKSTPEGEKPTSYPEGTYGGELSSWKKDSRKRKRYL